MGLQEGIVYIAYPQTLGKAFLAGESGAVVLLLTDAASAPRVGVGGGGGPSETVGIGSVLVAEFAAALDVNTCLICLFSSNRSLFLAKPHRPIRPIRPTKRHQPMGPMPCPMLPHIQPQ